MLTWLKRSWQDATVAQAPRLGPHANTAWAAAVHGPSALTPVGRRLPPCAAGPARLAAWRGRWRMRAAKLSTLRISRVLP